MISGLVTKLKDVFSNRLTGPEIVALVIVGVLLFVGAIYCRDWISDKWHAHKEEQFNARQAEADKKVEDLKAENGQLRGQIQGDMQNAQAKQLQIDALNSELEKYGKQAQDAVKAQQQASDTYAKEMADAGRDVPLYQRCLDYCRVLADIGKQCKPTVDQYCSARYAGR